MAQHRRIPENAHFLQVSENVPRLVVLKVLRWDSY